MTEKSVKTESADNLPISPATTSNSAPSAAPTALPAPTRPSEPSTDLLEVSGGNDSAPGSPLDSAQSQKRRRVTRACDECRKKKVKCDGKQPCIHCTVYSYDCTYNQPSNRRRLPDMQQVESKLRNAQAVLQLLLPDVDVLSPTFDLSAFLEAVKSCGASLGPKIGPAPALSRLYSQLARQNQSQGVTSPQLAAPQSLRMAYPSYGKVPSPTNSTGSASHQIDGSVDSSDGREIKIILPPKHIALQLVEAVWDNACVLFRFYHRPQFIRDMDNLYETDPADYNNQQSRVLPLVYSVMAVGVLFSMDRCEQLGFKDASEGYRYFVAARKLIDITDARDMYAIQTIVMMIIFLQCSARLSTCYAYIGVGLRSALREGLHRRMYLRHASPIEIETRKRIFWTIRKMDIYVNAMLGLPRSISEDDFDQELPGEYDDENITDTQYLPQDPSKLSSAGIANAHTRLITILSHIMRDLYPVKVRSHQKLNPYANAHVKVSDLENELREWLASLPPQITPGIDPPPEYLKANRLLHLAFCHIQIVLYRPFIHYSSPRYHTRHPYQEKAKNCARSCINVARTVIYIAQELVSKRMLNGAYWFSVYTIFFSVACLVYYVHENQSFYATHEWPSDQARRSLEEIKRDAEIGKDVLTYLKDSSMAALRIYDILNGMFEQLNRRTSTITEKSYGSGNSMGASVSSQGSGIVQTSLSSADLEKLRAHRHYVTTMEDTAVPDAQRPQTMYPVVPGSDESRYMPGLMDQVDQQIFGRFLPPYMLQNNGAQQRDAAGAGGDSGNYQNEDPDNPALKVLNGLNMGKDFDGGSQNATLFGLGSADDVGGQKGGPLDVAGLADDAFIGPEWDELLNDNSYLSGINGTPNNRL